MGRFLRVRRLLNIITNQRIHLFLRTNSQIFFPFLKSERVTCAKNIIDLYLLIFINLILLNISYFSSYFKLYTIDDRNIELIIKREFPQKISEKFSKMGNLNSCAEKKHCCEGHLATYRCQLTLKTSLSYYNKTSNERIIEAIKNGEITEEQAEILIKLKPYWSSCMSDIIQWEACEKCIKEDLKKYFTHCPQGWDYNPKCHFSYEQINV